MDDKALGRLNPPKVDKIPPTNDRCTPVAVLSVIDFEYGLDNDTVTDWPKNSRVCYMLNELVTVVRYSHMFVRGSGDLER